MTVAPGLTKSARDEAGPPDRRDEDVGARGDARQIRRLRVTDRDRGVALQEQHGHRLSDDLAPADHHGVAPGDRQSRPIEHLDHARRRARLQMRAALNELADVDRVEAVDVLVGIDGVEHPLRGASPHRVRQRRLHEDAVVPVAPIEPIDEREQLARATPSPAAAGDRPTARFRSPPSPCCGRRPPTPGCSPTSTMPRPGRPAGARGERLHLGHRFRANLGRDRLAVQQHRAHDGRSVCASSLGPRGQLRAP